MNKEQMTVFNRVLTGMLLKAIRSEAGMQQVDAAMKIGYTNATFVCSVEKGSSVIPADKVNLFSAAYLPKEKLELAAAILRLGYPDYWENSVEIICAMSGKKIKPQEIHEKVKTWLKEKMEKYNISFQGQL
jgi:DNA-binding XRE family transcriptional regulator